jgi:hypothetical protein
MRPYAQGTDASALLGVGLDTGKSAGLIYKAYPNQNGDPTLDPNWDPTYAGSYSLVRELHVEGLRLHTGGELKKVSGVVQNAYARLSPASL